MADASAWAWVEGRVLPAAEARIPLEDRGFLFAESVYEAILTGGGVAFTSGLHRARILRSAQGIGIDPARVETPLDAAIRDLLRASSGRDGLLYLQVTGGAGPRDHLPPEPGLEPRVYGTWRPYMRSGLVNLRARGLSVITVPDNRWALGTFKTTQLLGAVLAKRAARAAGAEDAIFVDDQGYLLEGSSTNLFLVRDGVAWTPPLTRNLLPGISRHVLLRRARDLVMERDLHVSELASAEELFFASTTRPCVPIHQVDRQPVGPGTMGHITTELARRFDQWMSEEMGPPGGAP